VYAAAGRWITLKVSDSTQRDILTIPQRRPIKGVYIRKLVRFVHAVKEARNAKT